MLEDIKKLIKEKPIEELTSELKKAGVKFISKDDIKFEFLKYNFIKSPIHSPYALYKHTEMERSYKKKQILFDDSININSFDKFSDFDRTTTYEKVDVNLSSWVLYQAA